MRITSVVKLHTANRFTVIGQPLMIAGFSFSVVLAIGIIANIVTGGQDLVDMYQGMQWNGAIFALLGPLMGLGVGAMTQYFPLATGLGLTRNEFTRGTTLVFLGTALGFAVFVTIGKLIEAATRGWGLHIRFFNVVYTGTGPAWQTLVQTFILITAAIFVGAALSTMVNRWGAFALWIFFAVLVLLGLIVVMIASLNDPFGEWLLSLLNAEWWQWMLVLAAVAVIAGGTWAVLVRRAQAR